MNVSAPFILRPIATTLLMIGLTLLGLAAYVLLPIAGVPQADVPTIRVSAKLPGANAETMATSVAAPLESQLALISGVTLITSTSSLGQTNIQVEFDLGRSSDGAAQDVQTAISAAGGLLPKNLPNPPTYDKSNPADFLLMSIAVTSSDLPISKVDEYVETYLAPRLSRIVGVGLVDYHGQQKPAIRIQINPTVAAAMGLSLEDIRAGISTATINSPKGTLDGPRQSLTLDTTDQVFDAATFNSVIIAYRNGAPVRVGVPYLSARISVPTSPNPCAAAASSAPGVQSADASQYRPTQQSRHGKGWRPKSVNMVTCAKPLFALGY